MKIAIVGSGISGLVSAYLLNRQHDVTVFEAGDYVGGHTNTVRVVDQNGEVPVDTGFIVYNNWTYPNFCRLLDQMQVATQPSDMSFSVRCAKTQLEYKGDGINTLFAQRRNILRPSFYRLLFEIMRFYRQSRTLLNQPDDTTTLGAYLREHRYSNEFIERHLIPMGAAIWSADPQQFYEFPARFFVRFCYNHGMLNIFKRPQWRVIQGGSASYIDPLTAGLRTRIKVGSPVHQILRHPDGVELRFGAEETERFDEVVLAVHSDQALRLLADPTPQERDVLGVMHYQRNETVLHTDTQILPQQRRAWASWNYHIPTTSTNLATLTYNMNLLQTLNTARTYCVTLNATNQIRAESILRNIIYHHPVYTVDSVLAQKRHAEISGVNRTHYCGAYWGYGFHEDGVNSALAVARHFGEAL